MDLPEALRLARKDDLDLVEVAPNADPPVCRIVDFKKFKYLEAKKERLAQKKIHKTETKEIWLGPLMGNHDLEFRLQRGKDFLQHGDRVKFTVKFSGREMAHPELGHSVLSKVEQLLTDLAVKDGEPRFLGRNLSLSFKQIKKGK